MRIAASLRVRCFNVSYPRGQARTIMGRQGAVAGAFSRAPLSQRLPAAKRRHPLLVGGARSGKAFVSCVASWRAARQVPRHRFPCRRPKMVFSATCEPDHAAPASVQFMFNGNNPTLIPSTPMRAVR
jgi:hypothetical protein